LGGRLFDLCLAHVRESNGRLLVLDTPEQMSDAIRFYEKRGFVRDDRRISAPRCSRGYALRLE